MWDIWSRCELFERMVQATYWYRGLLWPLLAKKVSFKVTLHVLDNQSKVSHILKYVGIHKMRGEKNHEPISIMRRSLQWSWPMTLPYLIFFVIWQLFLNNGPYKCTIVSKLCILLLQCTCIWNFILLMTHVHVLW